MLVLACGTARGQAASDKNLIGNASFEMVGDNKLPIAWEFHDGGAGATCAVDGTVARSGARSAKLTNPHASQPHVYGTLSCTVRVKPGTPYTLSLYARSKAPGEAWLGCGKDWEHRQSIVATGEEWQRFSVTFTTLADETTVEPRVNVDSETDGLWIDDVQLEEGDKATDFEAPIPLGRGETVMIVSPARVGENVLKNGSFEEVADGVPVGWEWQRRNTDARLKADDTRAHSGKGSVMFTSGTPYQPHVYSLLWYKGPVKVKPNTAYTFSAFVLSDSPGPGFFGGGKDWLTRATYPQVPTGGQWMRISKSWVTGPDETEIPVMLSVEGTTTGMWIDDVKLEEGGEATPFVEAGQTGTQLYGNAEGRRADGSPDPIWLPDVYPARKYVFAGWELAVTGQAVQAGGDTLHARVWLAGKEIASEARKLPEGPCAKFELRRQLSGVTGGTAKMELWLEGSPAGRVVAEFTLVTPDEVKTRLDALQPRLAALETKAKALKADGGDYVLSVVTIGRQFTEFVRQDLDNSWVARAFAQTAALEKMVDAALARKTWPSAPKYVTSPMGIDGPSFVAQQRFPGGRTERRPTFYVGMGAFGQARKDVPILPDYGMNIIQSEFGPNSVLPTEDTYSDAAINDFLLVCDNAVKSGVKVNLLISPHYFPGWAMQKWPKLGDCSGGFTGYCVHAAESRGVLEKYLRYVIPKIMNHSALHSICLSNEPVCTSVENCAEMKDLWHAWLERRYGTAAKMNEAWGSKYAGFADVPTMSTEFRADPMVYDFLRCNQEEFAGWHKFMADIIHEYAPNLPVHAKMMIHAVFDASQWGPASIAPELFAPFCAINGNDACKWYAGKTTEWATWWQEETMGYELQRCAREAPVFNSEDHMIMDRGVTYQPPEFLYNVHWEGAMHGRGASTTWVWERTYDPKGDFAGSILHRPEDVEAVGRCTLDLNRLAGEVTALQKVKPKVAVVYALSGFVWDPGYPSALRSMYRVATFLGEKTGFVYERQLEAMADGGKLDGYLSDVRVIMLPAMKHLSARAARGLERFVAGGGKIVALGAMIEADEHGQAGGLGDEAKAAATVIDGKNDAELAPAMAEALAKAGVTVDVQLIDADGKPVYGVDYWAAPWQGGWLVNISNYRNAEPKVRIRIKGKAATGARDLISGEKLGEWVTVPSLTPLLLQIR
jgi:hypothetical protein